MKGAWGIAALVMVAGSAVAADAPALRTLDAVKLGRWRLRDLDGVAPDRFVCAVRPEQIVYLGRGDATCQRRVLLDEPPHATVQFVCAGRGNGRTAVTAETAELLTIEAQGMIGGAPFDQRLEARWQGACTR